MPSILCMMFIEISTYFTFYISFMSKHFLLTLGTLLTFFTSCQMNNSIQENNPETATATLFWTGEIAADGCGFEIVMDGRKYLAENEDAIDEAFKSSDSTQVQLEFVRLPEPIDRRCGMLPQPRVMDAIRVVSITQP